MSRKTFLASIVSLLILALNPKAFITEIQRRFTSTAPASPVAPQDPFAVGKHISIGGYKCPIVSRQEGSLGIEISDEAWTSVRSAHYFDPTQARIIG